MEFEQVKSLVLESIYEYSNIGEIIQSTVNKIYQKGKEDQITDLSLDELWKRKERAKAVAAYIEDIGETYLQRKTINEAISVINEYVDLLSRVINLRWKQMTLQ